MKVRSTGRRTFAVLLIGLGITGVAIVSASARTSTITLHFFQKGESFKITDAAGKPVSVKAAPPAVGDIIVATDLDYVGNHRHHAKQWTASDHLRCTFESVPSTPTGTATAVCDGQIAIGGSMLLADNVRANLRQTSTDVPITGGTGRYRGYHGRAKSTSIGNSNNADFTIVVHR